MDVFTAISQRSSVRSYKATDAEDDKLRKVLEAARLSPSASNQQDWKFIKICQNTPQLCWGDEWYYTLSPGGRGLG